MRVVNFSLTEKEVEVLLCALADANTKTPRDSVGTKNDVALYSWIKQMKRSYLQIADKIRGQIKAEILFKKLILNFCSYNQIEKGLSQNTIHNYRLTLLDFGKFLGIKKCEIKNIKHEDILFYMEYLFKRGLAAVSVAKNLTALKMFFNFLFIESTISDNPTKNMQRPSYGTRIPDILSEEELCALMELE